MNPRSGIGGLSKGSQVFTACYVFSITISVAIFLFYWSQHVYSAYPLIAESWLGALMVFVGAIVGLNAARSFGGRRNIIGRMMVYFSISLLLYAFSYVALVTTGLFVTSLLALIWMVVWLCAEGMSVYAALATVKSLIVRFDLKATLITLICLIMAVISALLEVQVIKFWDVWGPDITLFTYAYPPLFFLQLGSALLLLRLLGRWYLSRSIGLLVIGYLALPLSAPALTIVANLLYQRYFLTDFFIIDLGIFTSLFLIGLGMGRVHPRGAGPFYTGGDTPTS